MFDDGELWWFDHDHPAPAVWAAAVAGDLNDRASADLCPGVDHDQHNPAAAVDYDDDLRYDNHDQHDVDGSGEHDDQHDDQHNPGPAVNDNQHRPHVDQFVDHATASVGARHDAAAGGTRSGRPRWSPDDRRGDDYPAGHRFLVGAPGGRGRRSRGARSMLRASLQQHGLTPVRPTAAGVI